VKLFDASTCGGGECLEWPGRIPGVPTIDSALYLVASETNRGQGNMFFPKGSYDNERPFGFNSQFWIKAQCGFGCGPKPR
jgi:hypothetical protein